MRATCTPATSAGSGDERLRQQHRLSTCRYCGQHASSAGESPAEVGGRRARPVTPAHRLLTPAGRRSPLCHQFRRPPAGAARNHLGGPTRAARHRSTQERPVLAGLHAARVQRCRHPAAARHHAGLRDLRRRPRLNQRGHRHAQHRRGPGPVHADPGRCRPARDDHRIGHPHLGAAADVAGALGNRHPQVPSHRRSGPAWHRDVRRTGLPRRLRPSGNAGPDTVSSRRRSGGQPRCGHHDRHDQLHRHHRPGRLGLRQRPRRRRSGAAAQHLGCACPGADGRRQRRPGRTRLRRLPPQQGVPAHPGFPAAAGRRCRGRGRAARQGTAGRTGRLRRAVCGHQLPTGAGSEGRRRRLAGRRPGRSRPRRSLGGHAGRRDHHGPGLPTGRPRGRHQQPGERPGRGSRR